MAPTPSASLKAVNWCVRGSVVALVLGWEGRRSPCGPKAACAGCGGQVTECGLPVVSMSAREGGRLARPSVGRSVGTVGRQALVPAAGQAIGAVGSSRSTGAAAAAAGGWVNPSGRAPPRSLFGETLLAAFADAPPRITKRLFRGSHLGAAHPGAILAGRTPPVALGLNPTRTNEPRNDRGLMLGRKPTPDRTVAYL